MIAPFVPPIFACLFMAAFIAARWPLWETAFQSDLSPVSWLSSAQLLAGALLALRQGAEHSLPRALSLWLAAGLTALALDDQFMLHEQWKHGCPGWTAACAHAWVRELPTLATGALGLCTLVWMHRALPYPLARGCARAAVSIGIFALVVDQAQMPEAVASLEEAFQVLAGALFLGALLAIPTRAQVHRPSAYSTRTPVSRTMRP